MDARILKVAILVAAAGCLGANQRTTNFIVTAPTAEQAREIAEAAERYRRDLAIEWLGREMPAWGQPCPITAQVGERLGAGGATSFLFEHGEVYGWRMTIQGSHERILDSVLPHEVTHTIFATHFRRPLPRWADEGACTTVEHESEKTKQQIMLVDILRNKRGIAFSQMFAMKEYPHDVMPLYSQGYSLARFLIAQGGQRKFLNYLADGMRDDNWPRATQAHYSFANLAVLQNTWLDWVRRGSPALKGTKPTPEQSTPALLADNPRRPRPEPNLIYRAQSSDDTPPPANRTYPRPTDAPAETKADSAPKAATIRADGSRANGWHAPGQGETTTADAVTVDVAAAAQAAFLQGFLTKNADAATVDVAAASDTNPYAPVDQAQPAAAEREADGGTHQMTRPQPIERPRQIILEWSKQRGAEPAAAAPAALDARSTSQPYGR